MSLFVGNLSKNVRYEELKTIFGEHGKCKIEKKVSTYTNSSIYQLMRSSAASSEPPFFQSPPMLLP